jgi:hydrogenase maturation protease
MSTLIVGIGNTLRGDDGVGPFVIDLLRATGAEGLELRTAMTVLPELAAELVGHEAVIFVDADLRARKVTLRPVHLEGRDGLHRIAPERVVTMARGLGFRGTAWICSLPVRSMEPGDGLSLDALSAAGRAAALLLDRLDPASPANPPGSLRLSR